MTLKFPIAAMAICLIAIGCSQQQNPRPMSPATPNATETPPPPPPSSTSPDGAPNTPPNSTNPPSQRPTPDSQR